MKWNPYLLNVAEVIKKKGGRSESLSPVCKMGGVRNRKSPIRRWAYGADK